MKGENMKNRLSVAMVALLAVGDSGRMLADGLEVT
jgi:hypothetical protein